jgi:hypothetical protein
MPDLSSEHAMKLHGRLRAFLLQTMARESPATIASALWYELVSLAAAGSETEAEAAALLEAGARTARHQLRAFGVGHPHPSLRAFGVGHPHPSLRAFGVGHPHP